jgi:hypothetical protein
LVAVNRAYERVPQRADALLVSMDPGFWREHGERVASTWAPPAVHIRVGDEQLPLSGPTVVIPCCVTAPPNPQNQAAWGTDLVSGVGCGGSSGYAAVNLADILGADTIYLLGFDLRSEDGRTCNWHDGYHQPRQDAGVYARMIAAFEVGAASRIRARVVNLSSTSALTCFPSADVNDVLP